MATLLQPLQRITTPAVKPRVERVAASGVSRTPERANKILQSSHAPAQLSLFLRPSGVR